MELISITNDVLLAKYFEKCGIDDIMVDLETIGKKERQKGLNTLISNHCLDDICRIKSNLSQSKCLVRINPIHENTKQEIKNVLSRGPDIIMLPMFTTADEVSQFTDLVGDKAKKYLLLETPQALVRIDDIIRMPGIDAVHIGLNDLSIGLGLSFLYEPLIGGIVEYMTQKLKDLNLKYGFGGVSRIEKGELILSEHYRLGSSMVIINRDFRKYKDTYEELIQEVDIEIEIIKIRSYLESLKNTDSSILEKNRLLLNYQIKEQMRINYLTK